MEGRREEEREGERGDGRKEREREREREREQFASIFAPAAWACVEQLTCQGIRADGYSLLTIMLSYPGCLARWGWAPDTHT